MGWDINESSLQDFMNDCHLKDDYKIKERIINCAKYEDKYMKSFTMFTEDECLEMYREIGYGETVTLKMNNVLGKYAEWLGKSGVYGQLNSEIRKNTLPNVYTKKEINDIVDSFDDPCDKFIVQALFNGICGSMYTEIIAAKIEDIHPNEREMDVYTVTDEGREYSRTIPIEPELIKAAEESNSLECYCRADGVVYSKVYGEGILKYRRNTTAGDFAHRHLSVKGRLNEISKAHGRIIAGDIVRSGLVYRLKVLAIQKGVLAEETISTDEGKRILKDFGYSEKNIGTSKMKRYLQ